MPEFLSSLLALAFWRGNSFAEVVTIDGTLNFLQIYNAVITARILLSWFPQAQSVGFLQPIFVVSAPYLNLFRGLGLNFAGIDFSVLPAFFLLSAAQNAVKTGDTRPSANLLLGVLFI